jgi:broad specificity phosphatase PhoE
MARTVVGVAAQSVTMTMRQPVTRRSSSLVLWARHGQNVANLTGTFSHRVFDGDLTGLGRRQARELADSLASRDDDPIGQLVCSPLRRARQTAQIVSDRLRLPVTAELDGLRELNVGVLDGRSDNRAWATYNHVLATWKAGDTQARFPGGEDRDQLCARLWQALAAVARGSEGATSLVVAHGASLRAAISGLTSQPDPGADMPTGAVAALRVDPNLSPPASVQLLLWPGSGSG